MAREKSLPGGQQGRGESQPKGEATARFVEIATIVGWHEMVPREQESDFSGESVVTCWKRSGGVESEDRGCISNSQKRVDVREEEITRFTYTNASSTTVSSDDPRHLQRPRKGDSWNRF